MKFRLILILFTALLFSACGNNEPAHDNPDSENVEEQEDGDTTSLTDAELFSMVLVNDILQGSEENDLQAFLEEDIYPTMEGVNKVTLDRLSASVYILTFEKDGNKSSILIQKFYDPANETMVFEKTPTSYGLKSQYVK